MPRYAYRAVTMDGRVTRGVLAALHESDVASHLREIGAELISLKEKKDYKASSRHYGRVDAWERIRLYEQMADMLSSGLGVAPSLEIIARSQPVSALRNIGTDIVRAIKQGMPLSTALAAQPQLFDSIAVAIIAAGEASGDVAASFTELARLSRDRKTEHDKWRQALRYPLFLLFIVLAVMSFMVMMVIPEIIKFLDAVGGQPTLLTKSLVGMASFMGVVWPWLLVGCATSSLIVIFMRRSLARAAIAIDSITLKLPLVGKLLHNMELSRFLACLATLYNAHVDILSALRLARGVLANRALQNRVTQAAERVRSGQNLSSAMSDLLPVTGRATLAVGEGRGLIGKQLQDVSVMLSRDTTAQLNRILSLLEPTLTLIMGLLLAWIVLAALGPIYSSLTIMKAVN